MDGQYPNLPLSSPGWAVGLEARDEGHGGPWLAEGCFLRGRAFVSGPTSLSGTQNPVLGPAMLLVTPENGFNFCLKTRKNNNNESSLDYIHL